MRDAPDSAELFRHVSAEKSALYRNIMDSFAAAKRQFRLHLRPDEVLAECQWANLPPRIEEVQSALAQLAEWGNLESQPDTARVASINDFYRARYLYRLSRGGEAVESALAEFERTLRHRAELQTVALEDIANRLQTLLTLSSESLPDAAKVHETLRDLVRVFESLADNAQAFMAGIGRSIELQQAEASAVVAYKKRLIDYLERFIGDLVARSGAIAQHIVALSPHIEPLLWQAAQREARDVAPGVFGIAQRLLEQQFVDCRSTPERDLVLQRRRIEQVAQRAADDQVLLDLPQVRPGRLDTPCLQVGGGNHSATSTVSLIMSFHLAFFS